MQTKKLQTVVPQLSIYLPIAIGITLLTFLTFSSQAQTFQWGIRCGSTDGITSNLNETIIDMATDPAGNVYTISTVGAYNVNVDGNSKPSYGGKDILLASFSCNGIYRWSKEIGGEGEDMPTAVKTDSLGGVYVTGTFALAGAANPNCHIDNDTVLSTFTLKKLFLLKFDTAGIYKWLVMPEADTVSINASFLITYPIDMDVDGAGNIYWLCTLAPGAYDNGTYIIDSQAAYILRYSKDGFYQTNIKLDLHYVTSGIGGMKIRHSNGGKYYCAGSLGGGALNIGGYQLTNTIYVCAFGSTGQALWVAQNANVTSQQAGKQALDGNNNMYITGDIFGSDTICGLTMAANNGGAPFIMAIDSNGNGLWAKCAIVQAGDAGHTITLRNSNEVVISGSYAGQLSWPGYNVSITSYPNAGYNAFVTRFNAHTGQPLGMDSLSGDFGNDKWADASVADNKGNIYIGGMFTSQIYIANDTLQNIGGYNDFFVAKYGFANCSCTTTPTADYSYATAGGGTVNFTYTGATPYDSLQWSFGDGSTAATANPSHTYTTTTGTYYACVTVFNSCGSGTYCDTVRPDLGVMPLNGMDNISVYPNPANSNLTLTLSIYGEGINGEGTYNVVLINVYGQDVLQQSFSGRQTVLDIKGLANGVYFIQLTDKNGQRKVMRVVKE